MLKNIKPVRYSDEATEEFEALLNNVRVYHSEKAANRLEKAVVAKMELLPVFPLKHPPFRSKRFGKVRKMVVLRKTVVLNRVDETVITIFPSKMHGQTGGSPRHIAQTLSECTNPTTS